MLAIIALSGLALSFQFTYSLHNKLMAGHDGWSLLFRGILVGGLSVGIGVAATFVAAVVSWDKTVPMGSAWVVIIPSILFPLAGSIVGFVVVAVVKRVIDTFFIAAVGVLAGDVVGIIAGIFFGFAALSFIS